PGRCPRAPPPALTAAHARPKAPPGHGRVMDAHPKDVHDRTPLIIGSAKNVDEVLRFVQPG
ncbi:MAG: hypothetical protein AAGB29_15190, partial [Planctomycetota bacterium]